MISFSDQALEVLSEYRKQHPEEQLSGTIRVKVSQGMNAKVAYKIGFESNPPGRDDKVFDLNADLRLVVDSRSFLFLNGYRVDYVKGAQDNGFVFQKGSQECL